jgi:hypothetical protein
MSQEGKDDPTKAAGQTPPPAATAAKDDAAVEGVDAAAAGQTQSKDDAEKNKEGVDATPEKKYIPATKEDHFENDTPKEGIKFYKKNESGDGVDNPPVEVTEPVIADVDKYMVEAPKTGNAEGGDDDDSNVNDQEQQAYADSIITTVVSASGERTTLEALAQAVEKAQKKGSPAEVEVKGNANIGGRRRTKRKGRKGSKKSKKGAKKSKKSSQSQNGGRRSRKNRRKHSHRRKH